MTPTTTPLGVVETYHRAWTGGDVDGALALVTDDATFTAPDPDVHTKDDWRRYLTAFVPMLTGAPEVARMSQGDLVALWYYPQTATADAVLASELFTIDQGRITQIRLAFDRLGYAPRESAG